MTQSVGLVTGSETAGPPDFILADYYKGSRMAALLDWVIFGLLILLILWTPLPFGSVEPLPIVSIEITALSCFLLWMMKLTCCSDKRQLAEFRARPRRPSGFFSVFGYPIRKTGLEWVALVLFLIALVQLFPLPAAVTAYLSPSTYAIYRSATEAVSKSLTLHALSLNPFATFSKLLLFAAYFLIYFTAVNNLHKPIMARVLIYSICLSTAFQSVYGLFENLSGRHHIFSFAKVYYRSVATGTFINGNHYALCLEMGIPFLLALILVEVNADGKGISLKNALRSKRIVAWTMILLSIIVSTMGGVLLSFSRSGILFTAASVSAFFSIYWAKKGLFSKRFLILALAVAGAICAILIFIQPLAKSFVRLPEEWTAEDSRASVWGDTLTMFTHFPIAGTGLGTYEQVYPMFHSSSDQTGFDHAHNDFLEFLAEGGSVFVLLYLYCAALAIRLFRNLMALALDPLFLMRLAACCSLLSLVLHGLVDFPLQIPAIPVLASVVSAIALNQELGKANA